MKNKNRMYAWMNSKLIVRDTLKYGRGTFSTQTIEKNELLFVFGGYVMTRKEEDALPVQLRDINIQIDRNLSIGVVKENQLSNADFVNHSCSPNAGIKGQISLVAMRNINNDEEITFDYGTVLYKENDTPDYEIKCLCGTKDCRNFITQNDWKILELQLKYKGYFPYYIQEEINRLNA